MKRTLERIGKAWHGIPPRAATLLFASWIALFATSMVLLWQADADAPAMPRVSFDRESGTHSPPGYPAARGAAGLGTDSIPRSSGPLIWRAVCVVLALVALLTLYRCVRMLARALATADANPAQATADPAPPEEHPHEDPPHDVQAGPEAVARVIRYMMAQGN